MKTRTWAPVLFVRSFFVQGTFNYRSLIGGGFAWLMLPVLRRTYGGDEELAEALERHAVPFNTHPYLVGVVAGAVTRMEEQRTDPETINKFKEAIRGSLGSLGDRLIWTAVLPTLLLAALVAWSLGGSHWLIVGSFLILYNVVHLGLRGWGLVVGLKEGADVGRRLGGASLGRWADMLTGGGCVLLGVLCGVLAMGPLPSAPQGWLWSAGAVGCFVYGLRRGSRAVRPARFVLVVVLSLIALRGLT